MAIPGHVINISGMGQIILRITLGRGILIGIVTVDILKSISLAPSNQLRPSEHLAKCATNLPPSMSIKWSPTVSPGGGVPITNSFPQCPLSRENHVLTVKVITKIPPGAAQGKTLRNKHKVRQGLIAGFEVGDRSDKG